MGQLIPKMRAIIAQGPPKTIKPPFHPPGQRPADACAVAQCQYCKRYGPVGACQGCGAPNVPVQRMVSVVTAPGPISATTASQLRRAWEQAMSGPGQVGRVAILENGVSLSNVVPSFDMVKR